jgi:hypothetical protein
MHACHFSYNTLTMACLQAMVTKEVAEAVGGLKQLTNTGSSVLLEGELAETPEGTKQVGEASRSSKGQNEGPRPFYAQIKLSSHEASYSRLTAADEGCQLVYASHA